MARPPQSTETLRNVYVAQTVREGQRPVGHFLERMARHLGPAAAINTLSSTHLTLLASREVTNRFRNFGYTPDDIRQFRGELERYLKDEISVADSVVTVNQDRPLRWMGGMRAPKLAFNIVPDEGLSAAREATEDFLGERFVELPDLVDFVPHITIGAIRRARTAAEIKDPCGLLPPGARVPERVAMNGLEVYLGRIHEQKNLR